MVDNGTLTYYTKKKLNHVVDHATKFFKMENFQIEKNKYWLRDLKNKKFKYINYISIYEFRNKTKISISFSYSRYKHNDNFILVKSDKEVKEIHLSVAQLFEVMTGEPVRLFDIELTSIDICNQIETNFDDKYQTIDLLNRVLNKERTTLYFHTSSDNRKIIQGFSIFEEGRGKKEQKTYFKIYNKFKERLETGKEITGRTQAVRAELTLRQAQLKKMGIDSIEAVNRKTLDMIIKNFLGVKIIKDLEAVIKSDFKKLIKIINERPFDRQDFLKYEYLIFDIEFLKYLFSPKISGMPDSTGRYHKKIIIEQLEELEKKGEIKKKYSGNIKDLEKILDKLFKVKAKITATAKGIDIKWLDLQENKK